MFSDNPFDGATLPSSWTPTSGNTGTHSIVARTGGGNALRLVKTTSSGWATVETVLSHATLKGRRVVMTAEIKATSVSAAPAAHNGVKVMLHYKTSDGANHYGAQIPLIASGAGTYDWTGCYKVFTLPEDVTYARLILGLELVSGTVEFDNVRVEANPVVFSDDFQGTLSKWSPYHPGVSAPIIEAASPGPHVRPSNVVKISRTTSGDAWLTATLGSTDIAKLGARPRRVVLRAWVKASGVSTPGANQGIKLMLPYSGGSSPAAYPQAAIPAGTFGWSRYSAVVLVPAGITSLRIVIGLQGVSGTVYFDDVHLDLVDDPLDGWVNPTPGHVGHSVDRLRGTMVGTGLTTGGVGTLAGWNVNVIRWQLGGAPGASSQYPEGLSESNYATKLNTELAKLDAVLPSLHSSGIQVVVDLHALSTKLFLDRANQDRLIESWKTIATRYLNVGANPAFAAIGAYDIANEPVELTPWMEDLLNWNELAERVTLRIRETDPNKTVIIEPTDYANPHAIAWQRPVRARNIVYSIHYYYPHRYTHWRVSNDTDPVLYYPGQTIDGVVWNQTAMRSSLAAVRDFEQRYGVHIYVGEFSAVRWVSGAAAYLADATALFEEYGWDWTYHAFAEWHGWSIQHDEIKTNTSPSPTQSPRATVLQNLFLLNDPAAPWTP